MVKQGIVMGGKARLNIPRDEEPLERRKIPRKWSLLPATLETPAGSFECRVLNLSPRGAKVELLSIATERVHFALPMAE